MALWRVLWYCHDAFSGIAMTLPLALPWCPLAHRTPRGRLSPLRIPTMSNKRGNRSNTSCNFLNSVAIHVNMVQVGVSSSCSLTHAALKVLIPLCLTPSCPQQPPSPMARSRRSKHRPFQRRAGLCPPATAINSLDLLGTPALSFPWRKRLLAGINSRSSNIERTRKKNIC